MITVSEITDKCHKMWKEVLLKTLTNELDAYFPIIIPRTGKLQAKNVMSQLISHQNEIDKLEAQSKKYHKKSYTLHLKNRTFRRAGSQDEIEKITVDSLEDYLHIVQKKEDYKLFLKNAEKVRTSIPLLENWVHKNILKLIEHNEWDDTLKVCHYFFQNPKPNLYVRQLPIEVHTKFIADNQVLILSLLHFLIPEHLPTQTETKRFEEKCNLLFDEALIRVRFLDNNISPIPTISYLSFSLSELKSYPIACKNIFLTENKMNFLTLPPLKNTVALWSGGGFSIAHLKNIEWLKEKQFFYWGDIDVQGLEILHQCRTYFPNTIAIMMDRITFDRFHNANDKKGESSTVQNLGKLTPKEIELHQYLKQKGFLRLEQEKIPQIYAEMKIRGIFNQ